MGMNNEKPQKILPVSYPVITTYTQHADLLSILGNYEQTQPWIFSNYIQLYLNRDFNHNWGDFYFPLPYELRPSDCCKWIYSQKISREFIREKWNSIVAFIIDSINMNNYVHMMVNRYYIPAYWHYQKSSTMHDILVYGYDLEEESFYVADFFKYGKYSFERVSFQDFSQGYMTMGETTNPGQDFFNARVYLYEYNPGCDYSFSFENITTAIRAYLNAETPEYWNMYNRDNKQDIVFGREVFSSLKNYLVRMKPDSQSSVDIRPFYMIYDHVRIMDLRVRYLIEKGYLNKHQGEKALEGFGRILENANTLVNLIIKYGMTKNSALIDRAAELLETIQKNQHAALSQCFREFF